MPIRISPKEPAVEDVAQLLEGGRLEAVGLVGDEQLDVPWGVGEDHALPARF